MKHQHSNRILSRNSELRRQLLQNLTSSLLLHGAIVTTEAKAKELRRFFEPLVTRAKVTPISLHQRRLLGQQLLHKTDLGRLFTVAAQHSNRPGGYIRLTRLPSKRTDAAKIMRIEILDRT